MVFLHSRYLKAFSVAGLLSLGFGSNLGIWGNTPGISSALAQDSGTTGGSSSSITPPDIGPSYPNGAADPTTNPFNPNAAGQFAQDPFQRCYNAVATPTCNSTGPEEVAELNMCPAGKFSPALLQKRLNDIKLAQDVLTCKKTKLDRMQVELGCMGQAATYLASLINSLAPIYTANFKNAAQGLQQIELAVADRVTQQKQVDLILKGNPATGKEGLLNVANKAAALVQKTQETLRQAESNQEALVEQGKALTRSLENRKMTLAGECFKKPNQKFHCAENGKAVSMMEYAGCYCQFAMSRDVNGRPQQSGPVQERANAAKDAVGALLGEIMEGLPQSVIPTSKEQADALANAQANSPGDLLTPRDIETKWGKALSELQCNGVNMKDFVLKQFQSCYNTSFSQVENEKTRPGTAAYQAQFQLNQGHKNYLASTQAQIDQFNSVSSDAIQALTGLPYKIPSLGCTNGNTADQKNLSSLACLKAAATQAQAIVDGDVSKPFIIAINGKNPASHFAINCPGVKGCVAAFDATTTALANEVARLGDVQKSYIKGFNVKAEEFSQSIRQALTPMAIDLGKRLDEIKGVLAGLGIEDAIEIETEKCQPFEDKSGLGDRLNQQPTDLVAHIGGCMVPALPKSDKNQLNKAITGIAKENKEITSKQAKLINEVTKSQNDAKECLQKEIDKLAEKARKLTELVKECATTVAFCGDSAGDLSSTLGTISQALSGSGLTGSTGDSAEFSELDSILRGVGSTCSKAQEYVRTYEDAKRDLTQYESALKRQKTEGTSVDDEVTAAKAAADAALTEFKNREALCNSKDAKDTACLPGDLNGLRTDAQTKKTAYDQLLAKSRTAKTNIANAQEEYDKAKAKVDEIKSKYEKATTDNASCKSITGEVGYLKQALDNITTRQNQVGSLQAQ